MERNPGRFDYAPLKPAIRAMNVFPDFDGPDSIGDPKTAIGALPTFVPITG